MAKFIWIVVSDGNDIQSGTVDTFDEAIRALRDWQGASDDPPHRSYQILPILPLGCSEQRLSNGKS